MKVRHPQMTSPNFVFLINLNVSVNSNAYMKWLKEQPKPIDERQLESFLAKPDRCDPEIRPFSQIWNYPEELVKDVYDLPKSLHKLDPKCIRNNLPEWG